LEASEKVPKGKRLPELFVSQRTGREEQSIENKQLPGAQEYLSASAYEMIVVSCSENFLKLRVKICSDY